MDSSDITAAISGLSNAAASWYNGISSGTPVIPSSQVAVANQLAINQASQLALAQTNPTLSGILANPGFLVIIGLLIVGLIAWIILK